MKKIEIPPGKVTAFLVGSGIIAAVLTFIFANWEWFTETAKHVF